MCFSHGMDVQERVGGGRLRDHHATLACEGAAGAGNSGVAVELPTVVVSEDGMGF